MTNKPLTGEHLVNALSALGIRFVSGGNGQAATLHRHPVRLICALASSKEARLRLALIPLFLQYPEYNRHVRSAALDLAPAFRLTLQCYYTAAYFLQQINLGKMQMGVGEKSLLPDLFSRELGLKLSPDPEMNLQKLAQRQTELSAMRVNWLGTYKHAFSIWMNSLQRKP